MVPTVASVESAAPDSQSFMELAFGDGTPKKAFLTALVVGTILTIINHWDLLIQGEIPPLIKVGLTYCVPYCVTTWGAITGKRAKWKRSMGS